MKRVRFETPKKSQISKMNDSECHSPRPYLERELQSSPRAHEYPRVLPFSSDPIQRYENGNCIPYPAINRLNIPCFPEKEPCWKPSDDLNLSLLDASNHEPRQPAFFRSILKGNLDNRMCDFQAYTKVSEIKPKQPVLSSIENKNIREPPNVLVKDDGFFLKRDNLDKYNFNVNPIQNHLNKLSLGKENNPHSIKADFVKTATIDVPSNKTIFNCPTTVSPAISDGCRCHHCIKVVDHLYSHQKPVPNENQVQFQENREYCGQNCLQSQRIAKNKVCAHCAPFTPPVQQNVCCTICSCHRNETQSPSPRNAVDKKRWAIEKYEESNTPTSSDVEKQTNISKEKREPTVADLFKIIKLQNEQLQLLQEKVDKFMSSRQSPQPTITCSTEHVAVNTVENDQHKMSIGVMTSFEMIRTSTVINKEMVTQTNENAQIQCNRSQISIKEVVSKPNNMNFLDGIVPKNFVQTEVQNGNFGCNELQTDNVCEDKTLNELSLYNVQVDNATTPLMSPEQTLYLDIRDYSDSEVSDNDHSNVGWTYYNKVMTHVNGMLQDSEMPSSASAMYRNMRQQCVQMQIDKTNVSVTKRVKFGDDPLGVHQPHIYPAPATETSLKMNQLAAKYLKNVQAARIPAPNPTAVPIDMSFATRNYMEKHRLLQGLPTHSRSPPEGENAIPRFLDITALKQQPKFL